MVSRFCLLLALSGLASCATYDERIVTAQRAYYGGNLDAAIGALEKAANAEPVDKHVAQLELATALQAAGRYAESTWLFEEADNRLEVLDYTSMPLAEMASFLLGGESNDYRASPPERVLVNTLNMLNYLGLEDPQEAAVEARRLAILLDRSDVDAEELYANRFAWSLAGFTFEMARDWQEAEDAWRAAEDSPLADRSLSAGELGPDEQAGTVLLVVQRGKVPVRRESVYLFPVGGGLHSLHVPTLVGRDTPFTSATVAVDGVLLGGVPELFNLGAHTQKRFKGEFSRLLAAAITQAIPRTALTEDLRKSAVEKSSKKDKPVKSAVAGLLSFLLDEGLAALTTTDTRSWSLLPEAFHARRLNLPPGTHTVTVQLSGKQLRSVSFEVEVKPGRMSYLNVTTALYEGFQELPRSRRSNLSGQPEAEQALEILEAASWWRERVVR